MAGSEGGDRALLHQSATPAEVVARAVSAAATGGPAHAAGAAAAADPSPPSGPHAEASDGTGQEVLSVVLRIRDTLRDRGPGAATELHRTVLDGGLESFRFSLVELMDSESLISLLSETAFPGSPAAARAAAAVDSWGRQTKADGRSLAMLRQLAPERRLHVMATLRVTPRTRNPSAALVGLCVAAQRFRAAPRPPSAAGRASPMQMTVTPLVMPVQLSALTLNQTGNAVAAQYGIPLETDEGPVPAELLPPHAAAGSQRQAAAGRSGGLPVVAVPEAASRYTDHAPAVQVLPQLPVPFTPCLGAGPAYPIQPPQAVFAVQCFRF
eukprot:TRINITY_DN7223_c0_g1_i2.p1 TRINITY_DN7223_c0_g1~~TRINITY_DN7223_c0_g1_i2.p1  ORF type:complete len:325 (+),score=31.28 TRINITY_DN7223_c0_g1_i2:124-1098(+)